MKFLASQPDQGGFYPLHQPAANTLPTVIWIHSQVMDPALLPFTASQDRTDYPALTSSNQKELRWDFTPGPEVADGVIVWRCTGEYFVPEFEYALLVFLAKRPDGYIQNTY